MIDLQLEDNFTDVTSKALRGLALTPGEAAALAGLPGTSVTEFLNGAFSAETAARLASALGLHPASLSGHPTYQPAPQSSPSIQRVKLPFSGDFVNAWRLSDGETAIWFDAGDTPDDCLKELTKLGEPRPAVVFITHGHRDHVGGIAALVGSGFTTHGWDIAGATPILPGAIIRCGALTITACDLSGHGQPALGYHVAGLDVPVLVTGDAIFAGSMGGCPNPTIYQQALRTVREVIGSLPESTVLLPGHGPATTLGEELRHNPFLASIG